MEEIRVNDWIKITAKIKNKYFLLLATTAGTCAYTIQKVSADICQLRLDFQTFSGFAVPTGGQSKLSCRCLNPLRAGGVRLIQPALFSDGYFSMKMGLEVQNFVTFPNSLSSALLVQNNLCSLIRKEGRIAHFTSELIKSGLMMLKNFRVDHRQG